MIYSCEECKREFEVDLYITDVEPEQCPFCNEYVLTELKTMKRDRIIEALIDFEEKRENIYLTTERLLSIFKE